VPSGDRAPESRRQRFRALRERLVLDLDHGQEPLRDLSINLCCGSSPMPGLTPPVVISSVGMRKGALSEVSGLTALPRPEFWHMTTVFRPASQAPAAIATASPSLAAPT